MESLNKINSLVDSARLNSTRTQPFYCDDDIFALDMQKVVSRKWLLVDHVNRIPEPEPGQFFLYEVGPESIIVIRDMPSSRSAPVPIQGPQTLSKDLRRCLKNGNSRPPNWGVR